MPITDQLDEVLREVSKKQSLGEIMNLILDLVPSELDDMFSDRRDKFMATLMMLQLRVATDKGFKAKAAQLYQEHLTGEDLDGDGQVYGKHWAYENPPRMLEGVKVSKTAKIIKFTHKNPDLED